MKFLDRYTSNEGMALIEALRRVGVGGRCTKEGLRSLCGAAALALTVAKAQHDRQADILDRFRLCLDQAWSDRATHPEVLPILAELTAILDEEE